MADVLNLGTYREKAQRFLRANVDPVELDAAAVAKLVAEIEAEARKQKKEWDKRLIPLQHAFDEADRLKAFYDTGIKELRAMARDLKAAAKEAVLAIKVKADADLRKAEAEAAARQRELDAQTEKLDLATATMEELQEAHDEYARQQAAARAALEEAREKAKIGEVGARLSVYKVKRAKLDSLQAFARWAWQHDKATVYELQATCEKLALAAQRKGLAPEGIIFYEEEKVR